MEREVYGFGLELDGKSFSDLSKLPADILIFKDRLFRILIVKEDISEEDLNGKYKVFYVHEFLNEKNAKRHKILKILKD